ncbi:ras-like protein [Anaeramoeba flamelloides]|uniref:Ras-like protein n=1 Tax=Anaeramoeba flamelloides TaxID=1746091 RepID=A0ABQ8YLC9_9EUKA|nr:ras-like protein [Anaeramoeba flamelloides]
MERHSIVVVGGGGVGKSAITVRFVLNRFVTDYDPTIQDSYEKEIVLDQNKCLLDILDTAGCEEFYYLQGITYRTGDGFLIVYSITDRSSFDLVTHFLHEICQIKDLKEEEVPMIIVGNKCDLEVEREVSYQEGQDLARLKHCKFIETSARTNQNLEEVFYAIARETKQIKCYCEEYNKLRILKKKKKNKAPQEEPCIII